MNHSGERAPAAVVFLRSGLKVEQPGKDVEGVSCRPVSGTKKLLPGRWPQKSSQLHRGGLRSHSWDLSGQR